MVRTSSKADSTSNHLKFLTVSLQRKSVRFWISEILLLSEMRIRRDSELHVAQTKTLGRRWNLPIFITTVCRFHFIKWSPVRVSDIGPKHYIINKVTIMYSHSVAIHSYSLPLSTYMNSTYFIKNFFLISKVFRNLADPHFLIRGCRSARLVNLDWYIAFSYIAKRSAIFLTCWIKSWHKSPHHSKITM